MQGARWKDCFLHSFVKESRRAGLFCSWLQQPPCTATQRGASTQLLRSHPFCWHRTYLQNRLHQLITCGRISTTTVVIRSQRVNSASSKQYLRNTCAGVKGADGQTCNYKQQSKLWRSRTYPLVGKLGGLEYQKPPCSIITQVSHAHT